MSQETLSANSLAQSIDQAVANQLVSEVRLELNDGSRLAFRHTVEERWVRAFAPPRLAHGETGIADFLLSQITQFRLNAKHLDITFADGSRFDARPWADS